MTSFQRRSFELPNATLSNRIDRTRRGGVDSIENITLCATSSDKIASIDRWIRSRILRKFLDELSTFRFRSTRAAIELFHKKSIDTKISPRRNKRERERKKVRFDTSSRSISLTNHSTSFLQRFILSRITYNVQCSLKIKLCIESTCLKDLLPRSLRIRNILVFLKKEEARSLDETFRFHRINPLPSTLVCNP